MRGLATLSSIIIMHPNTAGERIARWWENVRKIYYHFIDMVGNIHYTDQRNNNNIVTDYVYLFSSKDRNRLVEMYHNCWRILSRSTGGFSGRYRGPPRMEAKGRDYVERRGLPRRGGAAGNTSEARHGLSMSTNIFSHRPPNSSSNTFGFRATTLYGPSQSGDSGCPGAPWWTKSESAAITRC